MTGCWALLGRRQALAEIRRNNHHGLNGALRKVVLRCLVAGVNVDVDDFGVGQSCQKCLRGVNVSLRWSKFDDADVVGYSLAAADSAE